MILFKSIDTGIQEHESIVDTYAIKGHDAYNSPHSPPINYVIGCENRGYVCEVYS